MSYAAPPCCYNFVSVSVQRYEIFLGCGLVGARGSAFRVVGCGLGVVLWAPWVQLVSDAKLCTS